MHSRPCWTRAHGAAFDSSWVRGVGHAPDPVGRLAPGGRDACGSRRSCCCATCSAASTSRTRAPPRSPARRRRSPCTSGCCSTPRYGLPSSVARSAGRASDVLADVREAVRLGARRERERRHRVARLEHTRLTDTHPPTGMRIALLGAALGAGGRGDARPRDLGADRRRARTARSRGRPSAGRRLSRPDRRHTHRWDGSDSRRVLGAEV